MRMLTKSVLPTYHLARRGLDALHANKASTDEVEMSTWGMLMIGSTVFVFLLVDFMVEYTFGRLIPTLLMVESPQAVLFEPLTCEDPDAKLDQKGGVEPDLLLVRQQPITSSFQSTIKHLRARAGRQSHLRGLGMYLVKSLMLHFFCILLPDILALPIASILCAPFSLAWTHIVISDPSPLPWYKRMPDFARTKKVIPATVIYALAREAVYFLPTYLALSYGTDELDPSKMTSQQATIMVLKTACLVLFSAVLALLVLIPASVTLTRVQASLLAPNEKPIIPFDRTFGGRVSEDGVLGLMDAWRTFDRNSRLRLLRAYIKATAMDIALTLFFAMVLLAQAILVLGVGRKTIILGTDSDGNPIHLDF